jgi:hypothetical protein
VGSQKNSPFPRAQVEGGGGIISGGSDYLVLGGNLLLPFLQEWIRGSQNLLKENLSSLFILSHGLSAGGRQATYHAHASHSSKFPDLPHLPEAQYALSLACALDISRNITCMTPWSQGKESAELSLTVRLEVVYSVHVCGETV